jgi:tRNA(Ile)-lysidine synthase
MMRDRLPARREPGAFAADVSALAREPDEIVLRVLAIELKLLGSGKLLRLERLEFLAERLAQALRAGMGYGATLGGTVLRLNSNRTLFIVKEKARRRGRTTPHTLS